MTSTEGLRPTRQRRAVVTCLERFDDFRSAQEIHLLLRDSGERVGLATVYRTLSALAQDERVDVLRTQEGEARYRLCSTSSHHHHLVCRGCGYTVEVDDPAVERWAQTTGEVHGFSGITHTLEIFGTCSACAGS